VADDGVGATLAEATFSYAAGQPGSSHWNHTYAPSVTWRCPACLQLITDQGPYNGNALLAHFRPAERPLSQGRLIAFRVIDAAIQASASGVGGSIQMWYVDADGVHQADEDEINKIRSLVGGWQEEEGNVLDRIFGSTPPSPESEAVPLPPPSSDPATSTDPAADAPG
jgi:hypothetical protein